MSVKLKCVNFKEGAEIDGSKQGPDSACPRAAFVKMDYWITLSVVLNETCVPDVRWNTTTLILFPRTEM